MRSHILLFELLIIMCAIGKQITSLDEPVLKPLQVQINSTYLSKLRDANWLHVGHGGCTGGDWFIIGTANSLDEAKTLMLDHSECSREGSMLFYSNYSYDASWSVRCALEAHHDDCEENNTNWQEYILSYSGTSNVYETDAGTGGWGGSCACPNGEVYQVGDNWDACGSLACIGGTPGQCNRRDGVWSRNRATCAAEFQCAVEHDPQQCQCHGQVVYGRRYADGGNPGSGRELGYEEMMNYGATAVTVSNGSIDCSNGVFGDPLHGEFKQCFCVPTATNNYETNAENVGTWGGSCTCPNGEEYQVGDNYDGCASLACIGGTSGHCTRHDGEWSRNRATCGATGPNVFETNAGTGGWGGSCACPNGEVYQVGDNYDVCGSLACIGGTPGQCHRRDGVWSRNRATCAAGIQCAVEHTQRQCQCNGQVVYGRRYADGGNPGSGPELSYEEMMDYGATVVRVSNGNIDCSNAVFGDPLPGEYKQCFCVPAATNNYETNVYEVGGWGGSCTCSNGEVYQVGDNYDACGSLACNGGTPGICNRREGDWSRNTATCSGEQVVYGRCAVEHEQPQCQCSGQVVYGRRYAGGENPGSGRELGYQEMINYGAIRVEVSNGNIDCSNGVFGDPLLGEYKQCFCVATVPECEPPLSSGIYVGSNFIQVGEWRLGDVDGRHFSVAHQGGMTAMIYRSDGTIHSGPRSDYSTWDRPLTPSGVYFGDNFVQIGEWRLGDVDGQHFSVAHTGGMTAMIYRNDGTVHSGPRSDYTTYGRESNPNAGFGDRSIQIGSWRFGDVNGYHASITHLDGYTATIFRGDGTIHDGPRQDWTTNDRSIIGVCGGEQIVYERCAVEHEQPQCQCSGQVVYGRRFAGGENPGSGRELGYQEMINYGATSERVSNGNIDCSNGVFGDPLRGEYKQCFCVTTA